MLVKHLILLVLFAFIGSTVTLEDDLLSGHLRAFGSSGPFNKIEEYHDGFPNPWTFFSQYLKKSRPVLFPQVLANDSYRYLWEKDEYIREVFDEQDQLVNVETKKKESRQQQVITINMTDFLARYEKEELYLVEEVPHQLRQYFVVPKALQCEPALTTFQVAMMWFSSGNTSSVIHTDDYDNINCVLQGEKYFILVDPHENSEVASEIIDHKTGAYSSIDVDHVDYRAFPSLNNESVRYYQVKLNAGDCLFLPALWIHQVRSNYRNIAVNYWLDHDRAAFADIDRHLCEYVDESNFLTLAQIIWPSLATRIESFRDYLFSLVDNSKTSFRQWTKAFSKELNFNFQENPDIIAGFGEIYVMLDLNDNGHISEEEIETIFDSDKGAQIFGTFQELLDLIDKYIAGDPIDEITHQREDL